MATSFEELYTSVANWTKPFSRTDAFPLDRSSIFGSKTDADNYAKGDASDERGLGATSYIGQVISVYENDTVKVYIIGADRKLIEVTNQSPSANTWATKEYVNDTVSSAVTGLFKFKGSDTGSVILAKTNAEEGDVWNSTTTIEINDIIYPVGTNVVWVVDDEDTKEGHWDAFGGLCDLSGYLTKPDYTADDVNKVLTVVNEGGTVTHQWKTLPDSAIYWEDIV